MVSAKRFSVLTSAGAALLAAAAVWLTASPVSSAQEAGDDRACLPPCEDTYRDSRRGLSPHGVRLRTGALIGGVVAVTGIYGYQAWWHDAGSDFRLYNEGWFGKDTYAGGVDKLGHLYVGYAGTRLLTRGLEWAGNDRATALGLAALTVGGIQLGIEVMDGFDPGSGFGVGDAVANLAGLGLGVVLEASPALDAVFDIRVRYWPSQEARRRDQVDPFGDYSGQTYLLITKASAFPSLARHRLTRYLELAIGYGAVGFEPPEPEPFRRRTFYYGISINLSRLLDDTVFAKGRHPVTQRVSHDFFEYIQVPGTVYLSGWNF